jgi:hypothetical protein
MYVYQPSWGFPANRIVVSRSNVSQKKILSKAGKAAILANLKTEPYKRRVGRHEPPYMVPSTDERDYSSVSMLIHFRLCAAHPHVSGVHYVVIWVLCSSCAAGAGCRCVSGCTKQSSDATGGPPTLTKTGSYITASFAPWKLVPPIANVPYVPLSGLHHPPINPALPFRSFALTMSSGGRQRGLYSSGMTRRFFSLEQHGMRRRPHLSTCSVHV